MIEISTQAFRVVVLFRKPLFFQFSLRMPHQNYNKTIKIVHDIRLPANRAHSLTKKATGMASFLGSLGANVFNTPVQNGTRGAYHGNPSNIMVTTIPHGTTKIIVHFNKKSNKVKVSFFGNLECLDNHE